MMKKASKQYSSDGSRGVSKGNWKEFGIFLKYAHLSWGWIAFAALVTVGYYLTVTRLPGSTAALSGFA